MGEILKLFFTICTPKDVAGFRNTTYSILHKILTLNSLITTKKQTYY